jgi:hypothetical protein
VKPCFYGKQALFKPSQFLKRILKYVETTPACAVLALIYLERLQQLEPTLVLNSRTLQRLLVVAMLTATKYLEDDSPLNSDWCVSCFVRELERSNFNQVTLLFLILVFPCFLFSIFSSAYFGQCGCHRNACSAT